MQLAIRDLLRHWDLDITRLSYGRSLAGRLKILLQRLEIDCALDVGANVGKYAMSLRVLGFEGPIISFEPATIPFRLLKERAEQEPWWQAHQLALGSFDGERALNVMRDSDLNSFHDPNAYGAKCFAGDVIDHQETVPVARLDSISMKHFPKAKNIFLKIDAQGHDLEVFRGALGCLSQIALLQTELSVCSIYEDTPDWQSAIREIKGAGFVLGGLFAVSYNQDREVIEFDGLFIREL